MSKAYSRNLRGFPPNSQADRRFRPGYFFAGKDRADSLERLEQKAWKQAKKEKCGLEAFAEKQKEENAACLICEKIGCSEEELRIIYRTMEAEK